MLLELNFLGFSLMMVVVFFGAAIVCMGIVMFILKIRDKRELKKKTELFRNSFGIEPTRSSERTPGEQSVIDVKLKNLAEAFNETVIKKNEASHIIRMLREGGNDDSSILNELSARGFTFSKIFTISDVMHNLDYAMSVRKNSFWYTYELAKFFGYQMRNSYKEYLVTK
ncbi:MAG: hypothetical protein WC099_01880 [Candidatus Paceibacterota bacterium]